MRTIGKFIIGLSIFAVIVSLCGIITWCIGRMIFGPMVETVDAVIYIGIGFGLVGCVGAVGFFAMLLGDAVVGDDATE